MQCISKVVKALEDHVYKVTLTKTTFLIFQIVRAYQIQQDTNKFFVQVMRAVIWP